MSVLPSGKEWLTPRGEGRVSGGGGLVKGWRVEVGGEGQGGVSCRLAWPTHAAERQVMASPGRRHALSSVGRASAVRATIARRHAFASPCRARRAIVRGRAAKPLPRKRGPERHWTSGEPSMASSGTMSHVCLRVRAPRRFGGWERSAGGCTLFTGKMDGWARGAHLCISASALVSGGEHCASASSTSIVTTFLRAPCGRQGDASNWMAGSVKSRAACLLGLGWWSPCQRLRRPFIVR